MYDRKVLRTSLLYKSPPGVRTSRLRKMSADADALRRENFTLWNSFSLYKTQFPINQEPFRQEQGFSYRAGRGRNYEKD